MVKGACPGVAGFGPTPLFHGHNFGVLKVSNTFLFYGKIGATCEQGKPLEKTQEEPGAVTKDTPTDHTARNGREKREKARRTK
ncbi:hypothetical protein RSOLAG1IB_12419 [Rhizoctonia solani AG-1 IB]|uniref:Uncharacterized protein n=1 Tax=Thanatephorus cucumeris (strain AG1-IB / isolate 7/3/14) TaxID=1108050 RepID=A0A0B7FWM0_THACB|nr:hypothetical protein RSOLAG1IB_12419 [Rhizoctonia solani AG-1 IB]